MMMIDRFENLSAAEITDALNRVHDTHPPITLDDVIARLQ